MSKILSFDTSNYTTSACVFDTNSGIVWENRIMLPVTTGQCGLRQSEAVFLHNKNLTTLFDNIPKFDVDYVAVSNCPSERSNSYMPCFVVGTSFATSISRILDVPLYMCSHQKNHIGAAAYSGRCTDILKDEFFAFHISGGTTDILHCVNNNGVVEIHKIGGTADISCGQLIDRTGVMLGFSFPCGRYVDECSNGNLSGKIKISKNEFYYNFSGFENKIAEFYDEGMDKTEICNFSLDVVYTFLFDSIISLKKYYKDIPVILSGGVMSNKHISSMILEKFNDVYFAEKKYSVDNSLGTAYMCAFERGLLNE